MSTAHVNCTCLQHPNPRNSRGACQAREYSGFSASQGKVSHIKQKLPYSSAIVQHCDFDTSLTETYCSSSIEGLPTLRPQLHRLQHVPHCPHKPPACRGRRSAILRTCEGQPHSLLLLQGPTAIHSYSPVAYIRTRSRVQPLPTPAIQRHQQHGQHTNRERCLWRDPGAV